MSAWPNFEGAYIRTAAVEGRVIIEGEGLAGVTVTLTGGPGNDSYTKLTGDNGEYAFTELRPGDYQVSISGYDPDDYEFASSSHDVSVELDETETVSFTGVLLRTSGISGRVSVEGMGLAGIDGHAFRRSRRHHDDRRQRPVCLRGPGGGRLHGLDRGREQTPTSSVR